MTEAALKVAEEENVIPFQVAGNWLHSEELKVCILKTHAPDLQIMNEDQQREENTNVLKALIEGASGQPSKLQGLSQGKPVLVIAPELAYSSGDFEQFKAWVTA